ncbi:hypothetical protein LLG88_13675 [bacterium]|nr:hypothetical protein [bacterium]
MPVAPFLPAIIGPAGSVGGAAIAAHSAGEAADIQQKSASDALALQREMFTTRRADLQPWVTSGNQANQTLSALMGFRPAPAAKQITDGGTSTTRAPRPGPFMDTMRSTRTVARQNGGEPADIEMVLLRAPDGSQQAVPRRVASHYVAKGATLVQ